MIGLLLLLMLATPAPGTSAKWLRLLQPRRVDLRREQGDPPCPDKAELIALSKQRIEDVPKDLDALVGIQRQATLDRKLALPGNVVDGMHRAFLAGRNRLTTLAAHQYAWSAALAGEGPFDHHARVRMETSAGPRVVRVHLTGDRDEPEISVEIESSDLALEEDHFGAVGARIAESNVHLYHRQDPELLFPQDGPRPDRTVAGRVREDGTFELDRTKGRSLATSANFEDWLHVGGRIRDDGMVELWALDRKYVLNGLPLSVFNATAHGLAPVERQGVSVPPRLPASARTLVRSLVRPMEPNRWNTTRGSEEGVERMNQLYHSDFLHGATDEQLLFTLNRRYGSWVPGLTGISALFGSWSHWKYPNSGWNSDHVTALAVAPLARALEIIRAGGLRPVFAEDYVLTPEDAQVAFDWAKRFLTGAPVRADLVTPDTVPYLARMALAANIPFDDVKVQHAGTVIPLTEHPSFPRETRDLAAEEQFMNERLVALEQLGERLESPETVAAAEAEVHALLFGGPRFHFGDLVSQLVFYRELWGERLPAGASATPHAFEDPARGVAFVRELARKLRHPGAAAVLAGLLTRVPQEALQRALAVTAPHEAAVWARIGAGLQRFPAHLVPYVLSDLLVDPEHRHLDADVLDLRVRALQALTDLQEGHAAGDPLEALRREAAHGLGSRGTAAVARAFLDYAPFFAREGSLARAALIGFFQDRMKDIAETEDQAGSFFAPEFENGRFDRLAHRASK